MPHARDLRDVLYLLIGEDRILTIRQPSCGGQISYFQYLARQRYCFISP